MKLECRESKFRREFQVKRVILFGDANSRDTLRDFNYL